jgi:hypothetical protein
MWAELKPLRTVDIPGTLGDLESHLKAGHPYSGMVRGDDWPYPPPFEGFGSDDKVTDAHEVTHGINSRIRNEHRVKNGYYCLEDRAFLIPTNPDFTLRELAEAIPKDERGRSFDLYLVKQQRYWNDDPLYPLDELVAYAMGAKAGYELELLERANYSRQNSWEMYLYCLVAREMAREREFEHQEDLDEFLNWFGQELMPLCVAS